MKMGCPMETMQVASQNVVSGQQHESPTLKRIMSMCVLVGAWARIDYYWNSFSGISKGFAIGFEVILLSFVLSEFLASKNGCKFLPRNPMTFLGYVAVLLAIEVFGRH